VVNQRGCGKAQGGGGGWFEVREQGTSASIGVGGDSKFSWSLFWRGGFSELPTWSSSAAGGEKERG